MSNMPMAITPDITAAIYTLIERHLTEPFADDPVGRHVLRQADDACELLAAWLDAPPAMPEPTPHWAPVTTEDSVDHPVVCEGGRCLYFLEGAMVIEEDFSGNLEYIRLPDGYALCRLAKPETEAGR